MSGVILSENLKHVDLWAYLLLLPTLKKKQPSLLELNRPSVNEARPTLLPVLLQSQVPIHLGCKSYVPRMSWKDRTT